MSLKTIILLVVIVLASCLTLGGVAAYLAWEPTNDEDMIRVEVKIGESTAVEFEDLHMIPGEESSYTVGVSCPVNGDAEMTLSFDEKAEGTLKEFVYVRITNEAGEEICDLLLADAMEQEFTFISTLGRDDPYVLSITYYMPDTVGNEAKNASALFDLVIAASNEDLM